MAKIISFINYKGGVGKTTTTYHIGCGLAKHHGKRVLLVDIDPQTNLTFLCVDYEKWINFKKTKGTIANLYKNYRENNQINIQQVIWQQPIGRDQFEKIIGLDIIPCDLDLLGEDLGGTIPNTNFISSFNVFDELQKRAKETLKEWLFLKKAFEQVNHKYDYILIDCPPNIYLMTQNALVASDYYVVTAIPEYLSVIGLQILIKKVEGIKENVLKMANLAGISGINIAEIGGIIFVKARVGGRIITRQHTSQMNQVKKEFPDLCFESYTTELIGYSEAAETRLPIWLADTENAKKAARKQEYEKITEEFLRRFP